MQTVIADLAAKLKSAHRALDKARKEFEARSDDAAAARKALEQCESRVRELQDALTILKNHVTAFGAAKASGGGNVTPLRPGEH